MNSFAYWACGSCGRVATLRFPSIYTLDRICNCAFPHHVTQMKPLNDLAKLIDEDERQRHFKHERRKHEHQEMLKDWPP